MAYVKTVWETGDVITAAKLNNAENGIEAANEKGGVFMISETNVEDVHTLGKTWQEIHDAIESGDLCVIRYVSSPSLTYNVYVDMADYYDNDGTTVYRIVSSEINYLCDSADAYPVYTDDGT